MDDALSSFPKKLSGSEQKRAQLLEHLRSITNDLQSKKMDSETFHHQSTQILAQLFASTRDEKKRTTFHEIKRIVEEITAVSRGLMVRHEEHDTHKLIAEEQQKLAYFAHGKKQWLKEIERQNFGFIHLSVNPMSQIEEPGFAKLAQILQTSFSEKASFYALYGDELYFIREPLHVTKIDYPDDSKDEIKKLFDDKVDKLDLGTDYMRQKITDLGGQEIHFDETTARMEELIAKFRTEFATISDMNASYTAMHSAATRILNEGNIPDSLLKGLKDMLQSIDKLESSTLNPEYYQETIVQKNEAAIHASTELVKHMRFEGKDIKMMDPHGTHTEVRDPKKNPALSVVAFEIEVDALPYMTKIFGKDAIQIILPNSTEKQTPIEKNETWKKSERNTKQSVQPEKKRFLQTDRRQVKIESHSDSTESHTDSAESHPKPEKWVHAKPEKPKIKINVQVESLIKMDFEDTMQNAHNIVKDTKVKIHPEINYKTKVLDSIVFEFASGRELDAFKERIARAEKKVGSNRRAKDIEEPNASSVRVSSQFIRDNKKLIDEIVKEIESPERNIAKAGFIKKTATTKQRLGELLLGSQKPGDPVPKGPSH